MQVFTKIRIEVTVYSHTFPCYEVCIIHAELILSLNKIVLNNHNSRIKKWHIYILLEMENYFLNMASRFMNGKIFRYITKIYFIRNRNSILSLVFSTFLAIYANYMIFARSIRFLLVK